MEAKNIEQKEKSMYEEVIKPILKLSFKNMKWSNLKTTFKSKNERKLYLLSFFANPAILYFLLHNRYFELRLDITYYFILAVFGFFFNKGTYLFLKEKGCFNFKIKKSKSKLTDCKHEKQLCNALNSLEINHTIDKTVTNDFMTQIYVLSDAPITVMKSKNAEIAKRMHIDEKDLTISVVKGHFIFDIHNPEQEKYYFDEHIRKIDKKQLKNKDLPFVLGICQKTGKKVVEDLAKLLHLLVSGTTGGGKSSFINNLIQSLMLFGSDVLFVLIDFKGNELIQYKHFKNSIFITEHRKLNTLLDTLMIEMDNRYIKMGSCPDIQSYNKKHQDNKIPYVVVVIDEVAEIMLEKTISEKLNIKLTRFVNKGRAAGILFVFATQRPSGEQVDTDVRAILNTKITFMVTSKKETQFTETVNADKLIEGEFIIKSPKRRSERFKGLFLDREDEKRNFVFEELENKFTNGGKNNVFSIDLNK